MVFRRVRGRSHDRGRDFKGGRSSFEGSLMDLMVADIMTLIRGSDNIRIMTGIITSLRSVRENLVALNGHSWLMCYPGDVYSCSFRHSVSFILPLWYYNRTSMIDYVSSSSLRIIIQRLMHFFRNECRYCLSSKALDIRIRSLISHDGINQKFVSLHLSNKFFSVNIADGT